MADTVNFSLRLPADLSAAVTARAVANGCTKAEAMCHYIRLGMQVDAGSVPATREDVAALRDQVAALTEFQKAQAIALIDGVKNAIADAPVQALPSGVPEDEHARAVSERDEQIGLLKAQLKEMHRSRKASVEAFEGDIRDAVGAERERRAAEIEGLTAEIDGLRSLLAEERELSQALASELEAERAETAGKIEGELGKAGLEGYCQAMDEVRSAGPIRRLLGRF